MLKFTRTLIETAGLNERLAKSDRNIERFLRRRVSDFNGVSEPEIHAFIQRNRQISYGYGIKSEQGVGLFCLLQSAFDGQAHEISEIDQFLRRDRGNPEQDLRNLIDSMGEHAKGSVS